MNTWVILTDRLWKKIALGFVLIVFATWFALGIFTGFSTSPRYELNKRAFQKLGHPDGWRLVAEPASKDFFFLCGVDDQSCGDYVARFKAVAIDITSSEILEKQFMFFENRGFVFDLSSRYEDLCKLEQSCVFTSASGGKLYIVGFKKANTGVEITVTVR